MSKKSVLVIATGLPKKDRPLYESDARKSILKGNDTVVNFCYEDKLSDCFHHKVKHVIIDPRHSSETDFKAIHKKILKKFEPEKSFVFKNGHDIPNCVSITHFKEVNSLIEV